MSSVELYTIGFTKKSAEDFFTRLKANGVQRLIDVRLNNVSQLAGFAKRDDLRFFLESFCGIDYIHEVNLAPDSAILDAYKKQKGPWEDFERDFNALIEERRIEESVSRDLIDRACLLCSEDLPAHCHRRLIAEYLDAKLGNVTIHHL